METKEPLETVGPAKATHDTDPPAALIAFMETGWIDEPIERATIRGNDRFLARRAALSQHYPGTSLVVPAGTERVRANDTNFRFRTSSDFAYLVGHGEPGAVLVLSPAGREHRSTLFVPAHNRGSAQFITDRVYGELWVGRHRGVDESRAYYGVDTCLPLERLAPYLEELRGARQGVRLVRGSDDTIDALFDAAPQDAEFASHLSEMRLIKDAFEIAELRACCEISKRGFEDVIRVLPTARTEREIEAAFWRRARIEANDVGYLTIAAAGHHACTLHWNRNSGAADPGTLLLLDAGVEVESLYTADITRTLPIGGRFSAEQRAVYEIVYEAQRAGFAQVKPGNDFLAPNRAAMRVMAQGLIDLGILKSSLDEALDPERQFYRRYTLHNVSHMLGIDVHDCARARAERYRYGSLEPGMVLTVEPGLYFQPSDATVPQRFRGIGVRIEDDVLVTNDGHENLSAMLPSAPGAVEAWMAAVGGVS